MLILTCLRFLERSTAASLCARLGNLEDSSAIPRALHSCQLVRAAGESWGIFPLRPSSFSPYCSRYVHVDGLTVSFYIWHVLQDFAWRAHTMTWEGRRNESVSKVGHTLAEMQGRVRDCHVAKARTEYEMGDAKPSTGLHQKLLTAADHHTKAHLELEKAQMYLQYMRLDNFTQGRGVAHALVAILMASMPEKLMHLCTDAYRLEVDRKDEEYI